MVSLSRVNLINEFPLPTKSPTIYEKKTSKGGEIWYISENPRSAIEFAGHKIKFLESGDSAIFNGKQVPLSSKHDIIDYRSIMVYFDTDEIKLISYYNGKRAVILTYDKKFNTVTQTQRVITIVI